MKQFPNLTMEKVSDAQVTWGDYGMSRPQQQGDYRWNQPAMWRVTGPSGAAYMVTGESRGWMQTPQWYYYGDPDQSIQKFGFTSRIDALADINKREQAMQAAQ